jgi:hypothetical protein
VFFIVARQGDDLARPWYRRKQLYIVDLDEMDCCPLCKYVDNFM